MEHDFEQTLLTYNKNEDDISKTDYVSLSIIKSKIDDLSLKNGLDSNLLFLAATSITLTKYTNSTKIFISTKNNNSKIIPLRFNDDDRKKTVFDYIHNIDAILSDSTDSEDLLKYLNSDSHFNYIFKDDYEDGDNMSLIISESSNQYLLKLRFSVGKYTYYYIRSFLRSIKKVLNQFVAYGISNLKIEDIVLRQEQPTPKFRLKRNPLVNELLEIQTNTTPDKIALRTCGEKYTFRQVNDEANKIANALIKRGFKKGNTISFMLERNKTLITTFLGIIKAGCVAIPLDMNYPSEKINYILQNSDSEYIITKEPIDGAINPQDLIDEGDSSFPKVNLKADDPIFLLYTSGSTGNPKGVISTHCGISNLVSVHIKNNYKKLLSISSIAFDISEEDILVALTNDKELIFANDDEIRDVVLLSRLIYKTKPEFVNLTPSRLLSYLQVPEFAKSIKDFKGIGCGGEPFTKNIYDSIKKYADIDVYNGYGPLETSLTSNSKKIENPNFITNGKPLLNYVTDVRDIDGKLLPYWVIGELYIGGVGVSKGYYKLEDKTKEVFVSINNIPYYKSGDYAIQIPSGEMIIKGRVDNQIKLRGQRVDPEEIEQVIIKYPDIDNAVVISHQLNRETHLCAYFTSKININTEDLRNYLSNILSAYMIPTFFTQLDKFPETPNGKIDRKMFPKPKLNTENVEPINNFERTLYNFCTNILNYHDFGVTDNLFKLGFTSLTLMKLNSDIYHEFNISLKHTDLMDNPTIREISKLLENNTSIEDIEKIKPVKSGKYPMSSQQKRLYVLYCKNPTLTNYNLPNVRKFKKPLDINRLETAINKVIEAEEILRTSFHVENGEYIQKIHKKRPIKVDFIKVSGDIEEVFHKNILPFDLENDCLLKIMVIESGDETYVFRDIHHIIGDQISNDLLYDKIKDAYYNKQISANKIQYKDYTFWVEKQKAEEADFWKNKEISDFGTELPADFKRPFIQTFNGNRISKTLDKKAIEKLSKENNTTVYKLLLSQFIILLHKYTNERNIQIGTVTSGRTHPNLDETMGMFVNTLPFIQEISGEDTLKQTLMKTEDELSELFSNQNYSIEQIIEDHKLSTNDSYNPLFNIVFIQNTDCDFDNDLEWDESKFDLTCILKSSPDELILEFDYNKDLYTFEKINNLFNHYIYLIDNIGHNLDMKIKNMKVLSSSEEKEIIEISGSDSDIKTEPILATLKRQVAKNPKQIILSDDKTSLSYADFNLKTNSLANYLKDNFDVKEQDRIVLIANRSIESVLGFYSILKLNATYVPISPFAPKGRIEHLAGEVDAKLILTNLDLDIDGADIVDLGQKSLYAYDIDELNIKSYGNLCILHTSGTTGVPKGVQISHENVENFLISAKNEFYDENCRIFYHTTNIGFDTSLFEIIFSITNAMRLHVINEDYDFTKIPEDVSNQTSMINTVPSKLKMFLTLLNFENVMENVSHLILAGEALGENLVNEIRRDYDPVIYNAYGPCEATIFASIKKISSSDKISIGKANINTHIYILNDEKQLCPIGIPGELCIGGKQVSEGYINKADETERQFIDNPFDEGRLYCTGDLAYLDNDGEIIFIGRKDSQIKINGQRVETDEINTQIEKNKDVLQAITIPNSNKTQLYSYIVADSKIDIEELLNELETVLLPFMIPASIMQIDSIPLNNNGKIDVKKLPEPKTVKHKYKASGNDIEKTIVEIWEKVLEVKPIGINDNFYHLGGDSIKAIRIVSLLKNEGVICNPRDILNYKTPYLVSQNIGGNVEVSYGAVEGLVELLPIQNFFFDQVNRNDFTQEFVLESVVNLDINILQNALDELTNLHDMLRAKFSVEDGKYMQEILPLNTQICEINEFVIKGDFKDNVSKIIKNARNSLDVFNKLIDVSLVRHDGKSYLIFVIHHLIIDGVSWSIILDDLTYIYNHLKFYGRFNLNNHNSFESWFDDVKTFADEISGEENAFDDSTIICPLSESQLGIYLDEKINSKNTAYLTYELVDCDPDKSINEIERAILAVINKHPVLKARIFDNEISPLLICDSSPEINVTSSDDASTLLKAFDLEKSLSRFYMVDNDVKKAVFFEAHHIINDAKGCKIIEKDLISALNGNLDASVDLGFAHASYDSFKSQFEDEYKSAHEFYTKQFAGIDKLNTSFDCFEGSKGFVSLPIHDVKASVEEFTSTIGITVGNFLNAVFAYTYSRLVGNNKVYFNFTEHGRHEEYAQNAIGMFTRTVPLLVDCKNDFINEYLSYFSDLALGSMLNDVYPFRLLASEFNLNNDVMFEYNYDLNYVSDLKDNLVVRPAVIDPISDLLCVVNDMDDGYVVVLHHSDKFSRDAAIHFVKAYSQTLIQMMDKEMLSDIDAGFEGLKLINKTEHSGSYDDKSQDIDFGYAAPTDAIEKIIVESFEAVFNQGGIGINDDFIYLGGDSIMAIRVVSLLNKKGISYHARDILKYKTPFSIAQNIKNTQEISYEVIGSNDFTAKEDLNAIYYNPKGGNGINRSRAYSYKNWVGDVKELVNNISEDEKQHWIEVNELLDDSQIKGTANRFNFKVNTDYDADNLLMLAEEEYWALAIARAYKKTYGKDIIFNRESYGRDESLADVHSTVGWFTSQYPVPVYIDNNCDDVSLMKDVYKLKTAFMDVNNLGLNYASLIYTTGELEYKHCPVTLNFLSTEFVYKDELLKSINQNFSQDGKLDFDVYGVDLNITREDDCYAVSGDYPQGTYLADKFNSFTENIKEELKFIGSFKFKDDAIVCALSQPQLEVYFNEKEHEMGTAYSTWEIVECPCDKSIDQIKDALYAFIDKHPILKGRILDDDVPLLICDSYPVIEDLECENHFDLLKPFDLEKCLARFYIVNKKYIFYDVHHVINDAVGFRIIKDDLNAIFEGNIDDNTDLGFIYACKDSFESQFEPTYKSSHEFYRIQFADMQEVNSMKKDLDGRRGMVSLPIRGVKRSVEEFSRKNNVTVGTFLNSVFAYTYSRFIDSGKVCYNFVEHGRHENYALNALGMFARTTPILVDCTDENIKNYLSYFADLALNSMSNNVYPFRLLAKEFDLNNNVLFEYNFDLNNVSDVCDDIIVKKDVIDAFSQFFCFINDLDDGYVIHVKHTDMFSTDTAIRFVELFSKILVRFLDEN